MRILAIIFAALIVALQYPMWLGKGGWLRVRELDRQVEAQKHVNAELQTRNAALDAEVRDLKQGLEAVEERARSELGMRQSNDNFLLDHDRKQQYRQGDDDRRRGERPPRQLLEGENVVDRCRERPRGAAGKHRAENEIVPGKNEGENGPDDNARPRQRQRDEAEHRPNIRAVDLRCLLELARQRLEVPGHATTSPQARPRAGR